MNDGLSGWERMLATQSEEIGQLRDSRADYELALRVTLAAMKSALEQTARLREALLVVQARIDRTVAAEWWCYRDATGVEKYPGGLLKYVTKVLEENPG